MLKKNYTKVLKAIAIKLTIAFFFSCLITTILYFVCLKKVDKYISLFNNFTYTGIEKEKTVEIDSLTKELIKYPNYGNLFATIEMPSIDISVKVYHGDSLDILKNGAGHYAGSYFPGEGGTILIAAHNRRDYFKYLPKLAIGDKIIFKTDYGTFTYSVTSGRVMEKDELEKIDINKNEELLVLYTCYPVDAIGLTNQRYVVNAVLDGVSYES
jgi:sortase A